MKIDGKFPNIKLEEFATLHVLRDLDFGKSILDVNDLIFPYLYKRWK